MSRIIIKKGRAKPLWRGHPWVFRDSIARVEDSPEDGDLVGVEDDQGRLIGRGFFSAQSRIPVRILCRDVDTAIDHAFLVDRLQRARRLREETLGLPVHTDGYRLVHAEGDGLPGLVIDRYAGHLVVQLSTAGVYRRRERVFAALEEVFRPDTIWVRPDRKACALEGIPAESGIVRGRTPQEPPSILEHGVCFRIHLGAGHKTGFYTDQRDNRALIGGLARDRRVLDLHAYTGGFGLYAAVNGAHEVFGIDSSGPALALAAENAMLNNGRQIRFERADASTVLNELHRQGRRFDLVISDPPRFARDRAGIPKALRAYRDLHLRALRAVEPGGLLAVSSCSGVVSEDDFEQTLREAAYDVKRDIQILHRGGQAADHPVSATCPEGRYLKFMLVCVA